MLPASEGHRGTNGHLGSSLESRMPEPVSKDRCRAILKNRETAEVITAQIV